MIIIMNEILKSLMEVRQLLSNISWMYSEDEYFLLIDVKRIYQDVDYLIKKIEELIPY